MSRAILECTHLIVSKIALDTTARGRGDLAAGCMGAGQGGPNLGEILKILGAIKLNPDHGRNVASFNAAGGQLVCKKQRPYDSENCRRNCYPTTVCSLKHP